MIGKGLAGAALSVLALGSLAWAGDASVDSGNAQQGITLQPVAVPVAMDDEPAATEAAAPAAAAATPTPLMQIPGFGDFMTQNQLNLTGYVEGGYWHDLSHPASTVGVRSFAGDHVAYPGAYKDQIILDNVDLAFSRSVDTTKPVDIGFMIEGAYGRDSFFNHSNGIFDNYNKHGGGPNDQVDIQQAYVQVGVGVGNGLTINVGKFDALYGYETMNPTTNPFYTHSYMFAYGTPLTQTGITANYKFNDSLTATAGISRGWSESTDDNNGAIDGIWQVVYTSDDKKLTVTGNGSFGPEGVPGTIPYGPSDNSDYWFVPELIGTYQVSDEFKVAVDSLYGYANRFSQWYSVALYAGYTPDSNKYVTLNGRIEWYNDGHGLTTGVPQTTNFYEATVGLQIHPFPESNIFQFLQLRPEVRYDIADRSVFDSKPQQLSLGVDAVMQF